MKCRKKLIQGEFSIIVGVGLTDPSLNLTDLANKLTRIVVSSDVVPEILGLSLVKLTVHVFVVVVKDPLTVNLKLLFVGLIEAMALLSAGLLV